MVINVQSIHDARSEKHQVNAAIILCRQNYARLVKDILADINFDWSVSEPCFVKKLEGTFSIFLLTCCNVITNVCVALKTFVLASFPLN